MSSSKFRFWHGSVTDGAKEILEAKDIKSTPFLDVLIESEQKMVVANPAVQKYLSDVWVNLYLSLFVLISFSSQLLILITNHSCVVKCTVYYVYLEFTYFDDRNNILLSTLSS